MPYLDRDGLDSPETTQRLARFIPIIKLIDLLRTRALYFTGLPKLMESDPHEGRFDENELRQLIEAGIDPQMKAFMSNLPEEMRPWRTFKDATQAIFACCWFSFEVESVLMWDRYAKAEGAMLLTSVDRFRRAIANEERNVHLARMKYGKVPIDFRDVFQPALRKRTGYSDEREVRALMFMPSMAFSDRGIPGTEPRLPGIHVACDPSVLLEEIRVPPAAPTFVLEGIRSIVDRFGFTICVRRSEMDDTP